MSEPEKYSYQPNRFPNVSEKWAVLFDFYDKFGLLPWTEQMRAARYTGFPHVLMLCGSVWCLLLGWLYLACVGLYKPAMVLVVVLMFGVTLVWWWQSPWPLLVCAGAQAWAALRTHHNVYLRSCHDLRPWW